jgi:hypothetical protein
VIDVLTIPAASLRNSNRALVNLRGNQVTFDEIDEALGLVSSSLSTDVLASDADTLDVRRASSSPGSELEAPPRS